MKGGACESELALVAKASDPPSDRARHSVHFSSKTCEWPTPQAFFDALDDEFQFTLDPCSTDENAKCDKHFTVNENGLLQSWRGETVFMNPPYGREISKWMEKAYRESRDGATVVCLVSSRTDTAWWHDFAMKGEIRFLRGRLKFEGARSSAPFPSAVVVFRPRVAGKFSNRMPERTTMDDPGGSFHEKASTVLHLLES
jgi:phage N-6-adenine-methyltransferase